MTELERVWLACVIDCEGSMGVYKQPVGKSYRPQIRVDNIDYDFIARCKSIANKGNIFVEPLRGRHYLVWNWQVYGFKNCLEILQELYPYFIIKQKLARRVMMFCRYKLKRKGTQRSAYVEKIIATGNEQEAEEMVRKFG